MTAVVGILNQFGVALAADSAATYSGANGPKIYNSANKLFSLSKYHPVGVMIYNLGAFMGVPWETIIKEYRKVLGAKGFSNLEDYKNDFLKFIKDRNFFSDTAHQEAVLIDFGVFLLQSIINEVDAEMKGGTSGYLTPDECAMAKIESYYTLFSSWDVCPDFLDLDIGEFESKFDVSKFIADNFASVSHISLGLMTKVFSKTLLAYLRAQESTTLFTGVIFTGFGELEVFPQLIPVNISFAYLNRLRCFVVSNEARSISPINGSAISSFGQTDVIHTILGGIDPSLDLGYEANFMASLQKYNQLVLGNLGPQDDVLRKKIESIDYQLLSDEFVELNNTIKRDRYILPLVNAVATLAKEDLAEMAESLIYVTFLKRRITSSEESVGGPVDVAIITKGDGFIWIKRKHYFKPDLNPNFFSTYLS